MLLNSQILALPKTVFKGGKNCDLPKKQIMILLCPNKELQIQVFNKTWQFKCLFVDIKGKMWFLV